MSKVRPLRSKVYTLKELRFFTLDFIKKVRKQLQHSPYQEGMNDSEFLDQVVSPFEEKIRNDRDMERIIAKQRRSDSSP